MFSKEKLIKMDLSGTEIILKLNKHVYSPSKVSYLIAKNLIINKNDIVLDIGTGIGILAIIASKLGAEKVFAIEISLKALKNAKENIILNKIFNIELINGSLYNPLKKKEFFDLIVCNPPMTPSPKPVSIYTWGGYDGRKILDEVIKNASNYLKKNGRLIIPTISVCNIEKTKLMIKELNFSLKIIAEDLFPFSKIMIKLIDHIKSLPGAEIFYKDNIPHFKAIIFEAIKN
ncbi:MAG: methyltransferase [Nitrososphaerota archaeon]